MEGSEEVDEVKEVEELFLCPSFCGFWFDIVQIQEEEEAEEVEILLLCPSFCCFGDCIQEVEILLLFPSFCCFSYDQCMFLLNPSLPLLAEFSKWELIILINKNPHIS